MQANIIPTVFLSLCVFLTSCGQNEMEGKKPHQTEERSQVDYAQLARCLTISGWVVYSSFSCSACRIQRNTFGKAFEFIREIECNPYAPENQTDLCIKKGILKTPTWIMEANGIETERLEGYQQPEKLASIAGCDIP